MSSSIQSVERAMDILTLISKNEGEMGISDIARIMDSHKSTIHRTVLTLVKTGYLTKNENTGEYRLGKNAYMIGFMAANNIPLAKVAKPYMAFLSEKYQHGVNLNIFESGHVITITYYLGNFSSTFYSYLNQRGNQSPYRPAVVYCMLAFQSDLTAEDPLIVDFRGGYKKRGPDSMDELLENLRTIREQGYASEMGEFNPNEICYTAPIFDPPSEPGRAVATISIVGQKEAMNLHNKEEIIGDIINAGEQITNLWNPNGVNTFEDF